MAEGAGVSHTHLHLCLRVLFLMGSCCVALRGLGTSQCSTCLGSLWIQLYEHFYFIWTHTNLWFKCRPWKLRHSPWPAVGGEGEDTHRAALGVLPRPRRVPVQGGHVVTVQPAGLSPAPHLPTHGASVVGLSGSAPHTAPIWWGEAFGSAELAWLWPERPW